MKQYQKLFLPNKAPIFYIGSFIIGLAYLVLGNHSEAIIFLGLAFIFDPFDSQIPFPRRSMAQKTWLIIHLVIVLSIIAYELFEKIF